MAERDPPTFNGQVRAVVGGDGHASIVQFGMSAGKITFRLPTSAITSLQWKLRSIHEAAEDRKATSRPRSKAEDAFARSDSRDAYRIGVTKIFGEDRVGVQFYSGAVPDTYSLTMDQAHDLLAALQERLQDWRQTRR
ncbi:MAG: hypothetical protein GYB50_21830 [Rhodobacteraceae bacterium]|nr:hypothetical protein [Paracoccaceae bacterium]